MRCTLLYIAFVFSNSRKYTFCFTQVCQFHKCPLSPKHQLLVGFQFNTCQYTKRDTLAKRKQESTGNNKICCVKFFYLLLGDKYAPSLYARLTSLHLFKITAPYTQFDKFVYTYLLRILVV